MKQKTAFPEGGASNGARGPWRSGTEQKLRIRPRLLLFLLSFNSHLRSFQKRVREHMKTLISEADWLQDLIHPGELEAWNADPSRPCCTPTMFKLNFRGTPRDGWNISASCVFTDHFMATYSHLYRDTPDSRKMVLEKTQAHIKTLLTCYKKKSVGSNVALQTRIACRRRERKTAVSFLPFQPIDSKPRMLQLFHCRRNTALGYPQMQPQRIMLEALGPEGMSSEEEVQTPQEGKKYFILVPKWRAAALTPWLRIFDSLYLRNRTQEAHGDQRGTLPRKRYACARESTSQKWVPGLPINAYRSDWLERQLDVTNIVRPSPEQLYTHDPLVAQYVLIPTSFRSLISHLIKDWL